MALRLLLSSVLLNICCLCTEGTSPGGAPSGYGQCDVFCPPEEGFRGPPGIPGLPGFPGVPGPQGPPGTFDMQTDESGQQFVQGADGENGVNGPPGNAGDVGEPGATGRQGLPGLSCNMPPPGTCDGVIRDGAPGGRGQPGRVGLPGWPGIKGDRGLAGNSMISVFPSAQLLPASETEGALAFVENTRALYVRGVGGSEWLQVNLTP